MNDWKNFRVTEHRKSYQEKYEKREWKDDRNEEWDAIKSIKLSQRSKACIRKEYKTHTYVS